MNSQSCKELKVLDLVPFGQSTGDQHLFALRLENPGWTSWKPGQFVMLRPVSWGLELVSARPFSISSLNERGLTVFVQVVGRGTERIANLKPGDSVTTWGPLGTAFKAEPDVPTLILSGGIGLAPFVGYVRHHPTPSKIRLEFGHRLPLGCYPFDTIAERVHADSHHEQSVEDREAMFKYMEEIVISYAAKNGLVLACGPTPFLKRIQELTAKHKARCQISVETRMACGIGACLGCVVDSTGKGKIKTDTGKLQSCMHGPVFWSDEVQLEDEAKAKKAAPSAQLNQDIRTGRNGG